MDNTAIMELLKPKRVEYKLKLGADKKILFLSPHPDDETIGCGGLLAEISSEHRNEAGAVLFTVSNADRCTEMEDAKRELGYKNLFVMDIPDGRLEKYQDKGINRLEEIMKRLKPDIIFTPYIFDFVPDHFQTNICLKTVLERQKEYQAEIYMYEIWNLICYPNLYLDITKYASIKKKAMRCYKSQEKKYNLIKKSSLINDFRKEFLFRKKFQNVECYQRIGREEFIEVMNLEKESRLKMKEILYG